MTKKLEQYRTLIEEDINLLGYEKLRYSIFAGEDINVQEYQVRIEFVDGKYEVYMTADRASIAGKHVFSDIFDAIDKFLNIMQGRILINRISVKNEENPEYDCSLWGKEWLEQENKK
ncbi:Imm59 family immunity protein [Carnobacterium divergens]|uniref:Uncharacterized protein n=1 Tax=Carnobacterium divergens DSM 20623 TaxID=1449336 RepID=A0A0R2HY01_CARDV|nr:Imm59 family immunity protein [Carnobacterium divergens]KRN57323.1 hypothetical protein IV74_GL000304 [Carnobacterium divergens DSM 20623]MDO0875354.1 Imm59 family immunity protein [Carnobacterium divergens]SUX17105.1 Uncharacterised protein [Carnobacterium divergens]